MKAATSQPAGAAGLAAEFPGWRIWASRPSGLLWATRTGPVHHHDADRAPQWAMCIGDARTLDDLRDQLREQRRLDDEQRDRDTARAALTT